MSIYNHKISCGNLNQVPVVVGNYSTFVHCNIFSGFVI